MKKMTVDEIRDSYLQYFEGKGHKVLPSYSLVPDGDNSLLLINSGVATMKPYFTGLKKPPSPKIVSCQKCMRTTDIDSVGKKTRYGSFFEMLGNFSFGDYFKKEAIAWAWDFLVNVIEVPSEKLYISVYEEDNEAYDIWAKDMKIPTERICRLGKEDNFWEHGVGPCGPCSELHYDRGIEYGCKSPDCKVGCDCDRFMEVWNLVFTQFEKQTSGEYTPLEKKGIDTGMGLERLALVVQGVNSIYEIDNMLFIRKKITELANITNPNESEIISINIITDHVRSVAFMAADGVLPSNEGKGYVLRRLLRRAIRHGKALGLSGFVKQIVEASIESYSHAYPELKEKSAHIIQVLVIEENRFLETLDMGMNQLNKMIAELKESNTQVLLGSDCFKLYDTFGFPPDLTREILAEIGLEWDEDGFEVEMKNQKDRARNARGVSNYMGADSSIYSVLDPSIHTESLCYFPEDAVTEIISIISGDEVVTEAKTGSKVSVVLTKTPFYATSGGQRGDTGYIKGDGFTIHVTDCFTTVGNNIIHSGVVESGVIQVGFTAVASINMGKRQDIMNNHSATHLLQDALKTVLGKQVEQAGSYVDADRLRFDFTHTAPITREEWDRVELMVNNVIAQNFVTSISETTPEEARKRGALALFGEKYDDIVRVVEIGGSIELCGGTHVNTTGEIGLFHIVSEAGVASGVRRIEAVTGKTAVGILRDGYKAIRRLSEIMKSKPEDIEGKIVKLISENKDLKKEVTKAQQSASSDDIKGVVEKILADATKIDGFLLPVGKLDCDIEGLRLASDMIKNKMTSGCLLLCGVNTDSGTVQFITSATEDAVTKGIHAGQIVKGAAGICGGGGGGKPNHAQAGGKDVSKADEALSFGLEMIKKMLS